MLLIMTVIATIRSKSKTLVESTVELKDYYTSFPVSRSVDFVKVAVVESLVFRIEKIEKTFGE